MVKKQDLKHLIPGYIIQKFAEGKSRGYIEGSVLFVDIKGFTVLTDELMSKGRSGAEKVSDLLNEVFDPALNIVFSRGGFIAGFAGDAFTAIFPRDDGKIARNAAWEISRNMSKSKNDLSASMGISTGRISWYIMDLAEQHIFYFKGKAIDDAVASRRNLSIKKTDMPAVKGAVDFREVDYTKDKLRHFISDPILNIATMGEFREITSLFIVFPECSSKKRYELISSLSSEIVRHGGSFNKVDYSDKGGIGLAIFGAPIARENDAAHAVKLALKLKERFPALKMGLTKGMAYCGFIGGKERMEYTSIGRVVNLSARFAVNATKGQIITDVKVFELLKEDFSFDPLGHVDVKGFKKKQDAYLLSKELKEFPIDRNELTVRVVGREVELEKMEKFSEKLIAGRFAGFILVHGNGGMGKTTLVKRFRNEHVGVFNWLSLSCDDLDPGGFAPLSRMLQQHFNLDRFAEHEDKLEFLKKQCEALEFGEQDAYFLGEFLNVKVDEQHFQQFDSRAKYEKTAGIIKRLLLEFTDNGPLVIEIDDVQWIDNDTAAFFESFVNNIEEIPVMLICESREEDTAFIQSIRKKNCDFLFLDLNPLSKKNIESLCRYRLDHPASVRLLEIIIAKSEGNPLYIEEILHYLENHGLLSLKNGYYILPESGFSLPDQIGNIIVSRLDRLESSLRELVKTAAVLGKEFPIRVLKDMTEHIPEEMEELISEGEKEDIWFGLSRLVYLFKSALMRDAAYGMQLGKTLKHLHLTAAETIETIFKDDLAPHYGKLALHYDLSGKVKKAIKYYAKAGSNAWDRFLNSEALGHYTRLVELLPAGRNHSIMKERMGQVLEITGKWDEARAIFKDNLEEGKAFKDNEIIADALNNLGSSYRVSGDFQKSISVYEEALEVYRNTGDKEGESTIIGNMGIVYYKQGDYKQAMELYEKQLMMSKKAKNWKVLSHAVGNIGLIYYSTGEYEKALECYKEKIKLAEKENDKRSITYAIGNLGNLYDAMGDKEKSMEAYKQLQQMSKELGDIRAESIAVMNIGVIFWETGRIQEAQEYLERALEVSKELGDISSICINHGNMGELYRELGLLEKADTSFIKAIEIAEKVKLNYYLCSFLNERAKLLLLTGNVKLADSLNGRALKMANNIKRKETIIESLILTHRITALENKAKGLQGLRNMLTEDRLSGNTHILFNIARISRSKADVDIAKKALKRELEKTPGNSKYERFLKELRKS
ncbi:tetratricopeptide repeat protein [bacterium]|nr:tetratricopeptide repeat protein [bacterium]